MTTATADLTPEPSSTSFSVLKDRIKAHYDICSSYYLSLWGQHIHHGYWTSETDTIPKDLAQIHLIELLLNRAGHPCSPSVAGKLQLPSSLRIDAELETPSEKGLKVLDVGCGVGGTTRYLAEKRGWDVIGVTISSEQIKIAYDLTCQSIPPSTPGADLDEKLEPTNLTLSSGTRVNYGKGSVTFIQLDAELISPHFDPNSFDLVWISEALSHLPDKPLFFKNASQLLKPRGRLVIADWLKAPDLTTEAFEEDIKPIEEGMLLPPLGTMDDYLGWAEDAGLRVRKGGEGMDIGDQVKRTWDISLNLIQSPSLWAFALSQGRDVIAFLKAFTAMRRGFGNGRFRYGVVVFEKKE